MSRATLVMATALFFAAMLLAPSQAEARRKLVFITHGDAIEELADVPTQFRIELQQATGAKEPLKVGYFYSGFGVFGLDIWTWGGTYCLTADDTYWPLTDEQMIKLLGHAPSRPWNYSYPPGLFLLGVLIGGGTVYTIQQRKKAAAAQAQLEQLLQDPRYKQAVEQFIDDMQSSQAAEEGAEAPAEGNEAEEAARGEEAFNRAVQYLVDRGIEREEATKNLGLLLNALAASA